MNPALCFGIKLRPKATAPWDRPPFDGYVELWWKEAVAPPAPLPVTPLPGILAVPGSVEIAPSGMASNLGQELKLPDPEVLQRFIDFVEHYIDPNTVSDHNLAWYLLSI